MQGISLAETVGPPCEPLWRTPPPGIPDQELGEVVTNASVFVERREEYGDLIVSHLVEAAMLNREVPGTQGVAGTG